MYNLLSKSISLIVNSFVSISIDNYYEGNIVLLENGLPKTTKEDKDYEFKYEVKKQEISGNIFAPLG